ncbi:MAG: ArsR family transcriptional regulator [Magnetospiraceae bacterium]
MSYEDDAPGRRLLILTLLNADRQYSLNHEVLRKSIDRMGLYSVTDDVVKRDLAWLQDQDLVACEQVDHYVVARLTRSGGNYLDGQITIPGITRPRPV